MSVELRPNVPQPIVLATQAREEGLLLHDMQNHEVYGRVVPWLADYPTEWQAERYLGDGERFIPEEHEQYPTPPNTAFTTIEPRDPGELRSFQQSNHTQRTIGVMATRAKVQAKSAEGLKDSNETLAPKLINAFRSVTKVETLDVHLEEEKKTKVVTRGGECKKKIEYKTVDGVALFGNIRFTVADRKSAALLAGTFRKWLITIGAAQHMEDPHDVPDIEQLEDGQWLVQVNNSNEYDWRAMETALGHMYGELLQQRTGTDLPENKQSLPDWEQKQAETFHPWVRNQALGVIRDYRRLMSGLIVRYSGEHADAADRGFMDSADPDPLGTAPAALFEVIRKVSNGLTRPIRGPLNREQHTNVHKRLLMQQNINILRAKSSNIALGPGSPRTLRAEEEAAQAVVKFGKERATEFRERPLLAPIHAAMQLAGASAELAYELGLDMLGQKRAKELRKRPLGDAVAWMRKKKAAQAAGAHIDQIIERAA